jgi:hypothetical protein
MDIIRAIVTQVDEELSRISDERRSEDQPGLKRLEIKVLGQMSLLMDPVGQTLNPEATRDIDALLMGDLLAINNNRTILCMTSLAKTFGYPRLLRLSRTIHLST